MRARTTAILLACLILLSAAPAARAETLVRWTLDGIPSPEALGLRTIVLPLERRDAVETAARLGYRVLVEGDAAALTAAPLPASARGGVVVRGPLTDGQRRALEKALPDGTARILTVEEGAWPHVRLNAVTNNNGVLQVAGRTAQPWLEHNGALVEVAGLRRDPSVLLTYEWVPQTVADADAGPDVEHYLVAIADAGSSGASLLLPLHERLQEGLLRGLPDARRTWTVISQAMAFYVWELPRRYERVADVTVVAAEPAAAIAVLDLLGRHNVAFDVVPPSALDAASLPRAVVLLEPPAPPLAEALAAHQAAGHVVVRADEPATDPNVFAIDVRNRLGRERRTVDVWNGITVLVTAWRDARDGVVVLDVVNYAAERRPVQLRVRGTFASAQLETPGRDAVLIPFTQRDGAAELVLPDLLVGARVFLTPVPATTTDMNSQAASMPRHDR